MRGWALAAAILVIAAASGATAVWLDRAGWTHRGAAWVRDALEPPAPAAPSAEPAADLIEMPPSGPFGDSRYLRQDPPLETSYIFDAGVARVDGDRCLDLFTVNHSRRPVTLLNRGGGAFDMLDMQAAFPEIGFQTVPTRAPPPIPGFDGIDLRVFQQGGHLVLSASPQMQGEAALIVERWAPDALRAREVALGRSALRPILARRGRFEEVPADGKARRLRVVLSPGGSAVIDATLPARPVRIRIDDGRPMARLRWTADFERQGAWIAQRRLPDIHSVASGDWDLDGVRDAFLARGGMRGSAREAEAEITDFLAQLAPGGGGTARPAPVLGFEKRGCPIRQALVTDANADGEADLHLVCARAGDVFPDQVWLRREDGGFVEAAASLGLAFAERLSARWAHLDGDGRLDVAVRRGDRLWVYLNRAEGFEGTLIAEGLRRGNVPPPAVGDYDADGDLDLLVPAPQTIYRNDGEGGFSAVQREEAGLPKARQAAAQWADHDLDGRLDVHLIPSGLFRQTEGGRFEPTGFLRFGEGDSGRNAIASWFDADGDGGLDVFAVVERPFRNASVAQTPWVAALFLDRGASGGALVLDLVGPMENPDAVGARVRLTVDGRTRLLSPLAQETSRRSSGNREIVAGLGDATRADRIEVIWPDGARSAAEGVAAGAYEWRQGDPAPTPRVGACRG